MEEMTLEILEGAVTGQAVAIRSITRLQPAGGVGDKVFPPTYEGGQYAVEERVIDGQRLPCVLLDSVQSQANRLELALLEWHRSCEPDNKPFPLVQVDFSRTDIPEVGVLTALEAPHRIVDAIFLASEFKKGKKKISIPFRHPLKGSSLGKRLEGASPANATPVFEMCPTGLLFGMWDSHGARGGLGEKFQRALVSEVVGVDCTTGKRPASRIDPLIKTTKDMPIERLEDRTWRFVENGKDKLSNVGLGNVRPSLINPDTKKENHGGVTMRYAVQSTVLSLPALRRLRFPVSPGQPAAEEANRWARVVLASLGIAAVSGLWPDGFSLRSRCDLVPESDQLLIDVLYPGRFRTYVITSSMARTLVSQAAKNAQAAGLAWKIKPVSLTPNSELVKAVKLSRERAAKEG